MKRWTAILLFLAPLLAFGQGASDRDIQDALDRLTSQRDTPGYQAHPTRRVRLSVPPVDVPAHVELTRERFPDSAHNVTVNRGNLIRDGKPVFLIGVEAELYNGAWLHRILGIDFSQATVVGSAAYRSAIEAVEKRGADDATLLELTAERDDPWLETRIREVLRGGTLFTCDFAVTKSSFTPIDYRRYRVEPPVYVPGVSGFHKTSSHFLDLSQESPQGREIYHNMLRWFGRSARKYPVFLYELVNEVSYISPTPANIRAFHVQMRKKYGTIKQANAAWGAKFDAFTAVIPPINIDSSGIYNSKSGVIPHGEALSVPLWIDWLRFMETRAVEVFRDLADTQRKVDPRARTTFQTPYWTGTHAQFPHALTGVQDVYGAEHFLTLYRQKAGAEVWGEVRQMLAPQLANDLVRAASSSMPSINLEARVVGYPHDEKDPRDNYIIGPAGIRTFLWHQAVHGVSGSVVSYFYDNEVSEGGGSVWDPRWMSPEAVKELPRVKNAILSVADLVLPRPRIRGAIGLVYPRETARVLRPEKDDVYRQFLPEVLDYYAAATFTRAPVDALIGQDILDGKHRQLPMLVLAHCGRVLPDVLEELERYVQRGGVLVVSPDSLLVDDRFGEKLDASKLLGGAVGGEVFQEEAVRFRMPEVPSGKTIGLRATSAAGYDFARPVYGYAFKPSSAKPLGQTAGGAAALTANAVGQGTVYYLAREFEPAVRSALLRWIAARHGLKAEVDVAFTDGIAGDYVETHLFGGRGRRVVYALNFGGGPRKALLRPATGLPAEGARATVRDLHTGLYLGPGESVGRVAWERADLERGIAVELPMHDPVVLLVEDAALEPVPLRQLTAEQERTLRWLYRPSPKAAKRVLIDGVYVAEGRVHKWRMPTAVKLLEDNGYQVNSLCAPLRTPLMRGIDGLQAEALASYDVFVLSGTHGKTEWEDKDIRKVADYVQEGGGLLVCLIRDWHHPKPQKVLDAFGIKPVYSYMHDPKHHILGEEKYVTFTRIARHPVTAGVRVFQSTGMRPLDLKGSRAYALAQGSDSSYASHTWGETVRQPALPVIAALPYGKGRVVVVGSDTWLRPDDLELGDNRRFLLNAVQWLAGGGGDVAYVPPVGPKVDERDFAPRVRPAEVIREWDFERGGVTWQFARAAGDMAHSGKRSIRAGQSPANAAYDVVVRTTWQKDGLLDLPENPHVNFAYHADKAAAITVRVEIGKGSPRKEFEAKVGAWTFVSLPINAFDRAAGDQANLRLMEIQIVAGKKGDGGVLHLDDISITSGKHVR